MPPIDPARRPSHPVGDRPSIVARLPQLLGGLALFGLGIALMARAGLGLGPWEVLHQGLQFRTGIPMGTVSILLGVPILALWWPLGERPGIGTLFNVILIGSATNVGNAILPSQTAPPAQLAQMVAGVLVIGLGSGLYLAADLGPGPRDGLMVGIHHRFGWSIRRARTLVEFGALLIGWALGGTVGLGTIVFAVGIGPVVQVMLARFDPEGRVARRRDVRVLGGTPGSLGE